MSASDKVLELVGERLVSTRQEDEHDIFGRNIAAKLRKLLQTQRIYAEKIINDALYEAELNNLGRGSGIQTGSQEINPDAISVHRPDSQPCYNIQNSQHIPLSQESATQYFSSFRY